MPKLTGGGATITGAGPLALNGTVALRFIPSTGTAKITAFTLAGYPGNWTAQLDVTNNTLIVQTGGPDKAAQRATLADMLAVGRINPFTGNGIISSTAARTPALSSTSICTW